MPETRVALHLAVRERIAESQVRQATTRIRAVRIVYYFRFLARRSNAVAKSVLTQVTLIFAPAAHNAISFSDIDDAMCRSLGLWSHTQRAE